MIRITTKNLCCGCGACQQVCPKNCIRLQEDSEGFQYPVVDTDTCSGCNRCEKVCPVLNGFEQPVSKPESFACRTENSTILGKSSSGGVFGTLSAKVLEDGGAVFGARFDKNWSVVHDCAEDMSSLEKFFGSKYVQSNLGNSFSNVRSLLEGGRTVLFSGTPCQIAGLKHFLGKDYENFYAIDFVCHSIPAPSIWQGYLASLERRMHGETIERISFRDHSLGWKDYGIGIVSSKGRYILKESHRRNVYLRAMAACLTIRPSCTNCPARAFTSGSDIMLADCWGFEKYHPDLYDGRGMSIVLIKTKRGMELFEKVRQNMQCLSIPYGEVEENGLHSPIMHCAKVNPLRAEFFAEFNGADTEALLRKYLRKDKTQVRRQRLTHLLKRIRKLAAI